MSKKVAVVYHSGYGHTQRLAEAVLAGAAGVSGVEARLFAVGELDDAAWAELDAADALIFGSPTYMGSATAKFKEFMEASSKRWYTQVWKDKLAGGFTVSASQNGDKASTLMQLFIFAQQHGMLWMGPGLMPGNNHSGGSVEDLNRLGCQFGAMAQCGGDQGAEHIPASDLRTAEALGQRIAQSALRFA